jgi:hypothetical protein
MNEEHESFQSEIKDLRTEIKTVKIELEKARRVAVTGRFIAWSAFLFAALSHALSGMG